MLHVINADGLERFVRDVGDPIPADGIDMDEARSIVGGYVEVIPLTWGLYMLVDEDARMKDPPPPQERESDSDGWRVRGLRYPGDRDHHGRTALVLCLERIQQSGPGQADRPVGFDQSTEDRAVETSTRDGCL